VGYVKGRIAHWEEEKKDAYCKKIHLKGKIPKFHMRLRRKISKRPTQLIIKLIRLDGHPKIGQFQIEIPIQQKVLRLYVPMCYVVALTIFKDV